MFTKKALKRYIDRRIIQAIRRLDGNDGSAELNQARMFARKLAKSLTPYGAARVYAGVAESALKRSVDNIDAGEFGRAKLAARTASKELSEMLDDTAMNETDRNNKSVVTLVQKIRKLILTALPKFS